MSDLVKVNSPDDIFPEYKNTPISLLLEYHNCDRSFESYNQAQLLVGMCMDHRKHLHMPENFAYIIRAGGANMRNSEFKVSYAIGVGGVKHIAIIGHNNCGMVNLIDRKEQFVNGLVERAGWDKEWAEENFFQFAPIYEIGNEVEFVVSEAKRLRLRYPKIIIAPMLYNVDDNKLYLIKEQRHFS